MTAFVSFCLTVDRPIPKPPEDDLTDAEILDPSSSLLLQMFMAELDSAVSIVGGGEEEEESIVPLTPIPSSSLSPFPHHESVSLERMDLTGLDDPFLMEFTDINALLQDTSLIDPFSVTSPTISNSSSSPVISCGSPPQDPSLSPFSTVSSDENADLTFMLSKDVFCLVSPETTTPPTLSQEVVQHDHCYTTEGDVTSRKRQANSDALTNTSSVKKKPKTVVKDEKYFTRRHKNNVASQVSRAKRRAKHSSMFGRVTELEEQNAQLRTRVKEMTAEAERLRKMLVDRLTQ